MGIQKCRDWFGIRIRNIEAIGNLQRGRPNIIIREVKQNVLRGRRQEDEEQGIAKGKKNVMLGERHRITKRRGRIVSSSCNGLS